MQTREVMLQKIYEKPKVLIQIIKNAKSLNTNNQKCKKKQVQTDKRTLMIQVPNENQTRIN